MLASEKPGLSFGLEMGKKKEVRLTDELRTKIESGLKEKLSMREIAERCGISRGSLYSVMRKFGISNKGYFKIDSAELENLINSGMYYDAIAEKLGVSVGAVTYHIKRLGLKGNGTKARRNIKMEGNPQGIGNNVDDGKGGVICKPTAISSTKKKCAYGGRLGGCDCCDYILIENKQRNYDPENPQRCYSFKEASKEEKLQGAKISSEMTVV